MIWIVLIAVVVILAAGISIWGAIENYKDLVTQHPSFETLFSYTGIGERDVFINLFGKPDEFDCFYVPTYRLIDLPRNQWHRNIESPYLDMSCALAAGVSPLIWSTNPTLAFVLLAMAALIEVVGYIYGFVSIYRSDFWSEMFADTTDSDTQTNSPEDENG